MYIELVKNGETRLVKDRYLQNFLDQGWSKPLPTKKPPARILKASADVIKEEPVSDDTLNIEGEADGQI